MNVSFFKHCDVYSVLNLHLEICPHITSLFLRNTYKFEIKNNTKSVKKTNNEITLRKIIFYAIPAVVTVVSICRFQQH